jgi:hypothetical protein
MLPSQYIVPSVCPMDPLTAPDTEMTSALRVTDPVVVGM